LDEDGRESDEIRSNIRGSVRGGRCAARIVVDGQIAADRLKP